MYEKGIRRDVKGLLKTCFNESLSRATFINKLAKEFEF